MSTILHRSFLLGRSAGDAVIARGAPSARKDFENMRSLLYAGGLHRVRLRGGRGIDR